MITHKQWRQAHEIIDQAKKESAIEKQKEMQSFFDEFNQTFWKTKTDYSKSYFHVLINKKTAYYATVHEFVINTNGRYNITEKYFDRHELRDFVEGKAEDSIKRQREIEECDCECMCTCYENEELPKTNIIQLDEANFKKQVQKYILNKYSIGLKFKEEKK